MATMRLSMLAALAAPAFAAIAADQVTSLPGWSGPLLSNMYSGYLSIGGGKHLHYVFTESLNNPKTDPVTLWLNGGPGCSSLEGLIYEMGLYHVLPNSNPLTLYQNPFTWTNVSNMLYLEAPAGVGFSYCDTPDGCSATDDTQAVDNWNALQTFFAGFPEFLNNTLYLSGESYAGIYIPTLAYQVYQNNLAGNGTHLNLKGILVGNGCLGDEVGQCGGTNLANYLAIRQLEGHAMISQVHVDAYIGACGNGSNADSDDCQNALNDASGDVGCINVYDVYGECEPCDGVIRARRSPRVPLKGNNLVAKIMDRIASEVDVSQCDIDPGTAWLQQSSVMQALHVAPAIQFSFCSNNGTFQYESTIPDERTVIYPTLIEKAGYRVTIFNGEADACVPYTDNAWWTASMGYDVVSPWTQWTSAQTSDMINIGGYRIAYANDFSFVTVREAGHMVPEFQPAYAYQLFLNFLSDTWN